MDNHISSVAKSAFYQFRSLRHIRSALSDDMARSVASALIGARMDNEFERCKLVLFHLPHVHKFNVHVSALLRRRSQLFIVILTAEFVGLFITRERRARKGL